MKLRAENLPNIAPKTTLILDGYRVKAYIKDSANKTMTVSGDVIPEDYFLTFDNFGRWKDQYNKIRNVEVLTLPEEITPDHNMNNEVLGFIKTTLENL